MSYETKYHRDGTVTVWDIYQQQWARVSARSLVRQAGRANAILPTLSDAERHRICRMADR